MMEEHLKKADKLAREILILSRNSLLVNLRFLDMALSALEPIHLPEVRSIATDGVHLLYHPMHVLKRFKTERERSVRDYLHIVMHCVFRHMFVGSLIEKRLWNLSCDIAVESTIWELNLRAVGVKNESEMQNEAVKLYSKVGGLTAEKLYRYFLDNPQSERELERLEKLFFADDHAVWYAPISIAGMAPARGEGESRQERENAPAGEVGERAALEQSWRDISERMQQDLMIFSNGRYGDAGNIIQNLKEVNRERYDYSAFLKKFAVRTEVMKINDDEFDYIFYTYGLNLYKKMPLIEPLEYKDAKRIREFVIAIDTSGSVIGDLVQKFVQKTYNILMTTETFASKVNLHIIQCDTAIQEHVKLTTQEECERYIKNMTLKGFGGNNEILLFQYVDELIKNKEFSNLKGMIYLTDGYGIFPSKKPNYDVAFVFVNDRYEIPEVPPWVIKLTLKKEEI